MSYILDALRKSEHERQVASGQGAGMLYPMMAEYHSRRELKPLLLASSVLAGVAVTSTMIWLVWPKPLATGVVGNNSVLAVKPATSLAATSPPAQAKRLAPPAPQVPARKPSDSEPAATAHAKTPVESAPKKSKSSAPANAGAQATLPVAAVSNASESATESLKGMPKLVISGFINDEQGANLAIINDKLVHEGEEVAPGLRLEKIIDESAVFIYKGQRFRR